MRIGYARVSTKDQNLQAQVSDLEAQGCEVVFAEKKSGKNDDRPELQKMLASLKSGDEVIVTKIDRMARSLQDLLNTLQIIRDAGSEFRSLDNQLDVTTSTGKLVMQILGAVAEFERDLINDRVAAGMERAKDRGVRFGRPGRLTPEQKAHVRELSDNGKSQREIAGLLGTSAMTVNRALREI